MAPRGVLVLFYGCVEVFFEKIIQFWEAAPTAGTAVGRDYRKFCLEQSQFLGEISVKSQVQMSFSERLDAQQLSPPTSKCHLQAGQ